MRAGGLKLKYSNPIFLDDVAAISRILPIIMAHPSIPGRTRRFRYDAQANVYIDLSGGRRNISRRLVQYANTAAQAQGAVRHGQPGAFAGPLARGFCKLPIKPERAPADHEGKRSALLRLKESA